ncbi:hypothetical protein F4823DRAFT_637828 [Ustulina deusta]|nr:hypothetical protein F4823DRAFT_637828 [Ustulina deusta]
MANDNLDATGNPSGSIRSQEVIIVIIIILASAVTSGLFAYGVYVCHRTRSNRVRISDVEEGLNEEPIPLQDLQPVNNTSTAATPGTVNESANPDFSVSALPPRRPLNQHTMPLSSNPPSQADLDTARNALLSTSNAEETMPMTRLRAPRFSGGPPRSAGWPPQGHSGQLSPSNLYANGRRYGVLYESPEEMVNNSPESSDAATPEVETKPDAQSQKLMTPSSESHPPSTIEEGKARPEGFSAGTSQLTDSHSDPNLTADEAHEPGDQLIPSHENNQDGNNQGPAQVGEMKDADNEDHEAKEQPVDSSPAVAGPSQRIRGSRRYSTSAVYDPEDSRHDVFSALKNSGKRNKVIGDAKPAEETQQLSNNNAPQSPGLPGDPGDRYSSLQRDFTHASLVPAPLGTSVSRNNSVEELSSGADDVTATQPSARPASAIERSESPIDPDLIHTERPSSFLIQNWPPPSDDTTFDNPSDRELAWRTAPSPEIIEQSREIRRRAQWEENAKMLVMQRARDAGEILSDEELARRVRRLYERSSLYQLEPNRYEPAAPSVQSAEAEPASPPEHGHDHVQSAETEPASPPEHGHDRVQSAETEPASPPEHGHGHVHAPDQAPPRPPRPASGLYPAASEHGPELAFASSQALPAAAMDTSPTAGDISPDDDDMSNFI